MTHAHTTDNSGARRRQDSTMTSNARTVRLPNGPVIFANAEPDEEARGTSTLWINTSDREHGVPRYEPNRWNPETLEWERIEPDADVFEDRARSRYFTASEHPPVIALRSHIIELGAEIDRQLSESRHKRIALELLEDVQMRANRGIFASADLEREIDPIMQTREVAQGAVAAAATAQHTAETARRGGGQVW